VAYKKDQGRYARMAAFWGLFLLVAYGCFSELLPALRRWIGGAPWTDPLPLLGTVDTAKVVVWITLAVLGFLIYRFLNKPRSADLLIDTEIELRKVTWPSGPETWSGTVAVMLTVFILLLYLFVADLVLSAFLPRLMGA